MRWTILRFGLVSVWALTAVAAYQLARTDASAAQSVSLAWNANTEPDIGGYRLYYGTVSRVYPLHIEVGVPEIPSSTISASIAGLEAGRTYFFAVTALNRDGLESGYSDEISYAVPNPVLPPIVTESFVVSVHSPEDPGPPPTETDEVVEVGEGPPPAEEAVIMASSLEGPRLEMIPVGRPVVACFLSFDAPADRECELQVSRDLVSWQKLVPFTAASASRRFSFTDLVGTEPLRFYRLVVH